MEMQEGHIVSGKLGKAYAIIAGNIEDMFYAKDIDATIEKIKTEVPIIGRTGTVHKAGGWKGTGKMTIYYVTSLFRKMILEFVKTGKDTYFDLMIVNEDPTTTIGKQVVILKGVNLDSVTIAKFDASVQALEEEISFTFNDVEMPEEFAKAVIN